MLFTIYRYLQNVRCEWLVINFQNEDNTEWFSELFDDRRNVKNENKHRKYRLYQNSVKTEQYIKVSMSRRERRTIAILRSGALLIAIKTGRYSRPPTPVDDRLCDLCDMGVVENEKHFFLDCPVYSDLRYDLYYECSKYIDNCYTPNDDDTFINMIHCTEI